jgi:uncharacterized Tic20 family protein
LDRPRYLNFKIQVLTISREIFGRQVQVGDGLLAFTATADDEGASPEGTGSDPAGASPNPDEVCSWASFCHFSALFGLLLWVPTQSLWVPVGHLVGPLLVWLGKRNASDFIDESGRESINFQLAMSAYGALLALILYQFSLLSYLVIVLVLADIVLVIAAGVRVSRGESFRYPLIAYRLLS